MDASVMSDADDGKTDVREARAGAGRVDCDEPQYLLVSAGCKVSGASESASSRSQDESASDGGDADETGMSDEGMIRFWQTMTGVETGTIESTG